MCQRKAQTCGIQMVPIPSDLLALPFTLRSDPLRGPIFIPLNTECLLINKRHLFEGLELILILFYIIKYKIKNETLHLYRRFQNFERKLMHKDSFCFKKQSYKDLVSFHV